MASEPNVSWPCLWLGKISETSVKIIKNDTIEKAVRGRIESMQRSSATPSLRKIVACSHSTSQGLLVSTGFGKGHPYRVIIRVKYQLSVAM